MKKFFMALMAVAAISFVGCKPQNTPEGGEDVPGNKEENNTEVTCIDIKLYYNVEFTGKAADYVSLDIRYVEIPDSNKIATKENLTTNWKYDEYTVTKGADICYGLEYTLKSTDLFKEALRDEAKFKEMAATESKLSVSMCEKSTFSNGRVEVNETGNFTIDFAKATFDAAKADAMLAQLEATSGWAHSYTLDENNYIFSIALPDFWARH